MLNNLTNENLINEMYEDYTLFKLRRVGRKNMTSLELWRSWLQS